MMTEEGEQKREDRRQRNRETKLPLSFFQREGVGG
jgi:hypothetical protein